MISRNINDDSTLSYLFRQITDWLKFRKGGKGAAIGKAAERDNELDIGNWKLTCGSISTPSGEPLIKKKVITLTNVTIGSNGYTSISSYRPSGMNHFLFATMWNYGVTSSKDAITVNANGEFIAATGGSTISSINIAYFYMD